MRARIRWGCSICLLGLVANAVAMEPDSCGSPWRFVFGGAMDDRIEAVADAGAGDILAVGYTGGLLGVENFWPVGDSSGFVRKIDRHGATIWEHVFDTPGIDIVEAAAVATDGRVFVAGRTSGALEGQSNAGQLDLFVAVLSAEGDLLDLLETGDERPQHPVAVTVRSDSAFSVAGYDDVWVWGNAVMDRQNAFVAAFSLDASNKIVEENATRSGIAAPDVATDIAMTRDGSGDVLVSRYDGSDAPNGGIFVDRLTATGSVVWSEAISAFPFDVIAGVVVSPANRIFAAGTTYTSETTGGVNIGGVDGFLVELDPATGAKKWARPVGSAEFDGVSSLSIDNDANLVISGITEGAIAPSGLIGGSDAFAILITPEGNAIGAWQRERDDSSDIRYSSTHACGDSFAVAGSVKGIAPAADLGRTDAELTRAVLTRFETILRDGFDGAH